MKGNFVVGSHDTGKRLDHILPDVLHVSRSFVQRQIVKGAVTVNGKMVAPHYFVKVGDRVVWDIAEEKTAVVANAEVTVPILFEDDDLLVIDKPAGLVVHQGDGHRQSDTLVNWLLHARPAVAKVPFVTTKGTFAESDSSGQANLRPGIVHRLDRDVSGVMVIAKTRTMYDHLTSLFERGEVTKEYEAIVYGNVDQPEATLTFPLARSKTKGWKIAARPQNHRIIPIAERSRILDSVGTEAQNHESDEREAITHIVRIQVLQHYTLIRALPKTGRMHQIRVHCAAFGHPIVGDTLYAGKPLHPEREARLYLHATQIRFIDSKGNERVFLSPPPEIFTKFLREHL